MMKLTERLGKLVLSGIVAIVFFAVATGLTLLWGAPLFGDVLIPMYYTIFPRECSVTADQVLIEDNEHNPANNRQNTASVWMGTYGGKLYFHPVRSLRESSRTHYYHYLSVFENGAATPLKRIDGSIIGMQNEAIYFYMFGNNYFNDSNRVDCYDISSKRTSKLYSLDNIISSCYFSLCGQLYVPADSTGSRYYPVCGDYVDYSPTPKEVYHLDDKIYSVEGLYHSQTIMVTDAEGMVFSLDNQIPSGRKSIFPCKQGLLVHNEQQGELLYLICKGSGDVIELFTAPCIKSVSAINIWDNYVFLSFSRYQYDEAIDSTVEIKHDDLAGTYRINLENFDVQKVSDKVYNGLYIFDDTGIYACDEVCNMYKLDFEGNIIMTLLQQ